MEEHNYHLKAASKRILEWKKNSNDYYKMIIKQMIHFLGVNILLQSRNSSGAFFSDTINSIRTMSFDVHYETRRI